MIWPNAYERMIAWRYMRARRREGFVSVITLFSTLGIMLGVATLILVTSLMNGIREEMTSRFIGVDGHITVIGSPSGISQYDELIARIKAQTDVEKAIPKITGQVMASHDGRALGAQVIAMPFDMLPNKPIFIESITSGSIKPLQAGQGVVLGERLARNLGLSLGQQVTLISPEGRKTFMGVVPRMKAYTVVGTIKMGMHLYDSSLVLMPFEAAQTYFKLADGEDNKISEIEIGLPEGGDVEGLSLQIESRIQGGNYYVTNWQRSNGGLFQALAVQRNVMVVILTLIVLVAAFNIISSLIMLVQDKRTNIAILRTIGVQRGSVMKIFCVSGSLVGLIGTLLGLALGVLAALNLENIKLMIERMIGQEILVENIYFLSTLPTRTDWSEVAVIVGGSLIISFLATLYPAWKAAKVAPAEALRYE